jgi:2-amino-4-hydroxy-6-hydroxymethyldihydropteridine diphosphokinase
VRAAARRGAADRVDVGAAIARAERFFGVAVASEKERWQPAYVGIGSNLDSPREQVMRAFEALSSMPKSRLVARSRAYRTAPFGPVAQEDFVNAAAGMLTQQDPEEFLRSLREIEVIMGRAPPRERWGPRRIDLDLLALGAIRCATDTLILPHPGIAERDFVLVPLAEIAPTLEIQGVGTVASLLARVPMRGISVIEP